MDSDERTGTLGSRLARLWNAADLKKVPLRTIIVTILAVAFFYACAILSLPVMVHAVARAGMAKAEFQDPYLKALGVTLGLMPKSSQRSTHSSV